MPFPKTLEGLLAAGYKFDNQASCGGCNADIEWFFTPSGKKMPGEHEARERKSRG